MTRTAPRSTRPDTLFPYTTLVRARKLLEIFGGDVVHQRALDVGLHDRLVDMRRQAQEGIDMAADMIEERRSPRAQRDDVHQRSEEHTSALQSLMRPSYDLFCLTKKIADQTTEHNS